MLTKSKIQLIKEALAKIEKFRNGLEKLMDKYTIEDSIFVFNGETIYEATQGYFVKKSEHDTLSEAIRHCNGDFLNYGIRIINNEKFEVGGIKKSIVECEENSTVFDINKLTNIR